jgi:hypothetical protein
VEILVATALTLILMTATVQVFSGVGNGITNSRRALEAFNRLRAAEANLRMDLQGLTATVNPPARSEEGKGYFEYVEGGDWRNQVTYAAGSGSNAEGQVVLPNGIWQLPTGTGQGGTGQVVYSSGTWVLSSTPLYWSTDLPAYDSTNNVIDPPLPQAQTSSSAAVNTPSTVGQRGDILMVTTRNSARPFTGRFAQMVMNSSGKPTQGTTLPNGLTMPVYTQGTIQSDVAEVAWFVRGHTLHRRVLLVAPGANFAPGATYASWTSTEFNLAATFYSQFYNLNDVSGHMVYTPATGMFQVVPNSLADLTKRENRYAHSTAPMPSEYSSSPSSPSAFCTPTSAPYAQSAFPFDVRRWGFLGLPTLQECASGWITVNASTGNWWAGSTPSPLSSMPPPNSTTPMTLPKPGDFSPTTPANTVVPCMDLWRNMCSDGSNHADYNFWVPDWYLADVATKSASNGYALTAPSTVQRPPDDVILTNVIGFDVKVWDPGAPLYLVNGVTVKPGDPAYPTLNVAPNYTVCGYGAYVDLGYDRVTYADYMSYLAANPLPAGVPMKRFNHLGVTQSALAVVPPNLPTPCQNTTVPWQYASAARVYDTWSTSYESDSLYDSLTQRYCGLYYWANNTAGKAGPPQPLSPSGSNYPIGPNTFSAGNANNGFDDDNSGIVDDPGEQITSPPYPAPLRGIQVKIRVFEPDSRQIREVTIEQDFLPK